MSEKTELPTPKKLEKAREDGQVAHSKDFTQTVLILALFGYMLADSEAIVRRLGEMMVLPASVLRMQFEDAVNVVVTQLLRDSIALLLPYLLIVIGLGLFVEMLQTGMLVSIKSVTPSGKKLNVVNNVKNIVGKKNLVEFLKSNLKIAVLSAIIYVVLRDSLPVLLTLPQAGLAGVGVALGLLLKSMMVKISVGYAIIAAADFAWQRHQHVKQLMMSKDEVKQEYKEAEGDPHIKHQRKHLHQEMLQEGAVQKTRQASVVVTNPVHLAIAIDYEEGRTPLPVVLAKGEGALAARMVQAAREAGVPVLENVPLAWALMETASVDQYIPSELIEPVAAVLRMVREIGQSEE
ncbi:type III secretion system export apparatus subunit SctU [Ramlibacter sp. MAHUQ-53]|uniref:type III secretion system export apparatus subunit SctU n=1 Tax=unclassified Ramlibacter TaxID=2617605 RepID=UPI003628C466